MFFLNIRLSFGLGVTTLPCFGKSRYEPIDGKEQRGGGTDGCHVWRDGLLSPFSMSLHGRRRDRVELVGWWLGWLVVGGILLETNRQLPADRTYTIPKRNKKSDPSQPSIFRGLKELDLFQRRGAPPIFFGVFEAQKIRRFPMIQK